MKVFDTIALPNVPFQIQVIKEFRKKCSLKQQKKNCGVKPTCV